jgi:hypothetical protein
MSGNLSEREVNQKQHTKPIFVDDVDASNLLQDFSSSGASAKRSSKRKDRRTGSETSLSKREHLPIMARFATICLMRLSMITS